MVKFKVMKCKTGLAVIWVFLAVALLISVVPMSDAACSAQILSDCSTSDVCLDAGGYWVQGECSGTPLYTGEICNVNQVGGCLDETTCLGAGGDWNGVSCYPHGFWESQACTSDDFSQCTTYDDCMSAGGSWSGTSCSAYTVSNCSANDLSSCTSPSECSAAGGYWDGQYCLDEAIDPCRSGDLSDCRSVAIDTEHCVRVDEGVNLSIPCIQVGKAYYSVKLAWYNNPADPNGYYWVFNGDIAGQTHLEFTPPELYLNIHYPSPLLVVLSSCFLYQPMLS